MRTETLPLERGGRSLLELHLFDDEHGELLLLVFRRRACVQPA
jgi:hypothetical protein